MTVLTGNLVHHPNHSVLTLRGELDASSPDLITLAVDTVIDTGRQRLTVDVADLTFCDSQGLRILLHAERKLTAAGGAMELTHVHGLLGRVLGVTGLAKAFTITPSTV
ncbi:STAS domain-containing protein [Nonomuraea angiospora]|uniref:STAS domain-containing protein n=1 Tax=Nonomuraea angiospora TaxID=46172 RepID=UPI0029A1B777|nr:STAS domain-containing protein [Nonomuraea angiospora]MDX3100263.1 STAS domain-containing protein [Nonomuraea angiospora]